MLARTPFPFNHSIFRTTKPLAQQILYHDNWVMFTYSLSNLIVVVSLEKFETLHELTFIIVSIAASKKQNCILVDFYYLKKCNFNLQ